MVLSKSTIHEIDVVVYYDYHSTKNTSLRAATRHELTEKKKQFISDNEDHVEQIDFYNYRTVTTRKMKGVNQVLKMVKHPQNCNLKIRRNEN